MSHVWYLKTLKIDFCKQVFFGQDWDDIASVLIDEFLVQPLKIAESSFKIVGGTVETPLYHILVHLVCVCVLCKVCIWRGNPRSLHHRPLFQLNDCS